MRRMLNGLATAASVCNSRHRGPTLLILCLFLIVADRAIGQSRPPQPATVNDRLWAWAHDAGVYNGNWGLPGPSRMTPVEGAAYLGLKNVIFIRYLGKPAPPFDHRVYQSLRRHSQYLRCRVYATACSSRTGGWISGSLFTPTN